MKKNQTSLGTWTKKWDTLHYYRSGEPQTLCGKPMLGNDYSKHYQEYDADRKTCPECKKIAEAEKSPLNNPKRYKGPIFDDCN